MLKKLWNMGRCSYYKNTVYITAIDHHNTCISTCITYTHFYQLYQCPYALSQYRCKECIFKKLSQKSHTGFLTISKGLTTLQEAPVFSMTQIEWGGGRNSLTQWTLHILPSQPTCCWWMTSDRDQCRTPRHCAVCRSRRSLQWDKSSHHTQRFLAMLLAGSWTTGLSTGL